MQTFKEENPYYIGIDIGGSHFSTGVLSGNPLELLPDTILTKTIHPDILAYDFLHEILESIKFACSGIQGQPLGIGISIPGPFIYESGTSCIAGLDKFEDFFGVNLKHFLVAKLDGIVKFPDNISFLNDADSFALGECHLKNLSSKNVIGITLGTGIGSGFIRSGKIVTEGKEIPADGNIYNIPYKSGQAEDWLSTRWFLRSYRECFNESVKNVEEIAKLAEGKPEVLHLFNSFGHHLGDVLSPIAEKFRADSIVLGGGISRSFPLFKDAFYASSKNKTDIYISKETSRAAMVGAVLYLISKENRLNSKRNTAQFLMPEKGADTNSNKHYNIYPTFEISSGDIHQDLSDLIQQLPSKGCLIIDGYQGTDWNHILTLLALGLEKRKINFLTYDICSAYKSPKEIEDLVQPFLGGLDPVFGKLYTGKLNDFFDSELLKRLQPKPDVLNIIYGCGAALSKWEGVLVYIDIPKNEIQYRSRAGIVHNLGNVLPEDKKQQYKRMYFVDWPVLNRHKHQLIDAIDYFIDGQYFDDFSWATGTTMREALRDISSNAFRVRPWFEPGIWGGTWMKENFKGLAQNVPNYAWSFELIVPENGIVFSKNDTLLEISFDFLMFYDSKAILGNASSVFGTYFPIRFDYLDTVKGQNLSVQCHPTPEYITANFGEKFTQDETYYILEADKDAQVYLGFQEGVEKEDFKEALYRNYKEKEPFLVEKFIQRFDSNKHDLFLIPHGTVHCSGAGNVVLEISSTPYIFTFKMFDWDRVDLDGNPRPLNIERGLENLDMSCKGNVVETDYISKPVLVDSGKFWNKFNLPTHPKHYYEINRFELETEVQIETHDQCHILNLVEGSEIEVLTKNRKIRINFAETFVIPAAVGIYTILNLGSSKAKVIQANVKPEFCETYNLKNNEIK